MNTDQEILDGIAETIERLRTRINQHSDHIGGHETRTRVILIDPLLRSLGWNTEAPEVVVHEYRTGSPIVDYALLRGGEVFGIIEAKAYGSRLNDEAWGKYAEQVPGVPVIAFTNGDEWRFFRQSNDRRRETVKISGSPGGSFKVGFDFWQKIGRGVAPPPPPPPEWKTLRELLDKIVAGELPKGKRPGRVVIDGDLRALSNRTWKQLYVDIAEHLVAIGRIHEGNTPIKKPKAKNHMINDSGEQPDGKKFVVPVAIGRRLWLEANVSTEGAVDNAIFLLEWCGIDPSAYGATLAATNSRTRGRKSRT